MVDDELARRRKVANEGGTDLLRWSNPASLEPAWNGRAKLAATFIPAGARVLDLGCGSMALEGLLPEGCAYQPCDVVARDNRTLVCDFNAGQFPSDAVSDVITVLGVLEYLSDVPAFLTKLRATRRPIILSYSATDSGAVADRRALGWTNDYSREELFRHLKDAGFRRYVGSNIENGQILIRLDPTPMPTRAERRVWVLSFNNVGNFGDRLGTELLSRVLPPWARVSHIHHRPLKAPPGEQPDLLIVGLGGSMFAPLLDKNLAALVRRAPRKIGIFGTQYRADIQRGRLDNLLDELDLWFARYEEDVLLYGRGRDNVHHLGDWLIDAFPMARATSDTPLTVGKEAASGEPLDRLIELYQRHKVVVSPKLHPLLCALTAAERVAYREQFEEPSGIASGKMRSMLLDVFQQEKPQDALWAVDRLAVQAYKTKVAANVAHLRHELLQLLS